MLIFGATISGISVLLFAYALGWDKGFKDHMNLLDDYHLDLYRAEHDPESYNRIAKEVIKGEKELRWWK